MGTSEKRRRPSMTTVLVHILKGLSLIVLAAAVPGFLLFILAHSFMNKRRIPTFTLTSVHPLRAGGRIKATAYRIKDAA